MSAQTHSKMWMSGRVRWVSFGLLALWVAGITELSAWAAPAATRTAQGNAEAGRSIFNGKGVCYYCHGVDGHMGKRPELAADTAALIARLNPPPTDLRNPKVLHLNSDKQRMKAIREGHPGTGMFPDTTMTNQELADTVAYLALLRKEGSAGPK